MYQYNAPINGLPWGYNPGRYQGEREEYWRVTNRIPPPPRATGEITKFAFAFLEGERRGDFLCPKRSLAQFCSSTCLQCTFDFDRRSAIYIQKTMASEIQVCINRYVLFLLFVYCIMFLNYF